ncbi:protein FAR1-RELATED SEQUENCE 5-like [Hordeum vulgare]|nr:protein FAR1-RELATED SEQUENCE 5-like [Hordeum vulgare]
MTDVNELPLDIESINILVELGAPFLHPGYEQDDHHFDESVGESGGPNIGSNGNHVPDNHVGAPSPLVGPANAIIDEAPELEDEEAWSQPQEPYVGMKFDTLVVTRGQYNHYALRKVREKLGSVFSRNPYLVKDFTKCINFSFTLTEFEWKWVELQLKYEGLMHRHFEKLYEYLATWVPCYFKYKIFPFLQSTQHIEAFHAVLKRYVDPHKSILNFFKQYEKIEVHILMREGGNDYQT